MRLAKLSSLYQRHRILQPKTKSNYEVAVTSLAGFIGVDPCIGDISEDLLLDYRQEILSTRTPVTFNTYRRHLSALFNFAVKKDLMASNPFSEVKAAPVPKRKPKTIPISVIQEIVDFLAKSGDKYDETISQNASLAPRWFWLVVVKTLYHSAIRRKQLVELRLKDINFEEKLIRLRSEGSKTLREWDIPLPDAIFDDLKFLYCRVIQLRGRYDEEQQLFCYPLVADRLGRFKKPEMSVDNLSKWFARLSLLLGRKISPHRIRHTTATELARKTENMRLVQEILGHTDLRTTYTYVDAEISSMRHLMGDMRQLVSVL